MTGPSSLGSTAIFIVLAEVECSQDGWNNSGDCRQPYPSLWAVGAALGGSPMCQPLEPGSETCTHGPLSPHIDPERWELLSLSQIRKQTVSQRGRYLALSHGRIRTQTRPMGRRKHRLLTAAFYISVTHWILWVIRVTTNILITTILATPSPPAPPWSGTEESPLARVSSGQKLSGHGILYLSCTPVATWLPAHAPARRPMLVQQ